MPATPHVLGIVAGGGSLPREIAEHVTASGGSVHVVAIDGEHDASLAGFPVTSVGWAQIGGMLQALRRAGVREIVIAGSVRRPDLTALKPDLGFFLNLPAIGRILAAGGDDGVLSRVVRFFEGKGFKVLSPIDVAPSLLVGEGPLGKVRAEAHDLVDIARGFDVVRTLGRFDVGQAVVVSDGRLEAIEGPENTDSMLGRLAMQRQAAGAGRGRHGVLVKRPKPAQEMRVDLPAIGPGTVARAIDAGLRGIAVLAGGAIALDRATLVERADAGALFVKGVPDRGVAVGAVAPRRPFTKVGKVSAGARQLADVAKGAALLDALRPYRISGGVVVDRDHVLAVECGEGIAAMIARAGSLRQWGRRGRRRSAIAVLSEAVAADLGAVFADASAARLAGIAVLDRTPAELAHGAASADHAGLFLLASPRQAGAP